MHLASSNCRLLSTPCFSEDKGRGRYLFGFNGQLKDNEVYGEGNGYTAEFWEYDPRIGRRWNVDPIVFPHQSPYACYNNNPIYYADPNGMVAQGGPGAGDALASRKSKDENKLSSSSSMGKGSHGTPGTGIKTYNSSASPVGAPKTQPVGTSPSSGGGTGGGNLLATLVTIGKSSYELGYGIAEYADTHEEEIGLVLVDLGFRREDIFAPYERPAPGTAGRASEILDPSNSSDVFDIPVETIDMDPPSNMYVHYTDGTGVVGITSTQAIFPNQKGKVYITQSLMSAKDVEQNIFLGNPLYKGRGDYAVVFYVRVSQEMNISKDPTHVYEYIYQGGALRLSGQILYAGPNLIPNK